MSVLCDNYIRNREDMIVDGELVQDFMTSLEYMDSNKKRHIKTLTKGFSKMDCENCTCKTNEKEEVNKHEDILTFIDSFSEFTNTHNFFMMGIKSLAYRGLCLSEETYESILDNDLFVFLTEDYGTEMVFNEVMDGKEFDMFEISKIFKEIIKNNSNGLDKINTIIKLIS